MVNGPESGSAVLVGGSPDDGSIVSRCAALMTGALMLGFLVYLGTLAARLDLADPLLPMKKVLWNAWPSGPGDVALWVGSAVIVALQGVLPAAAGQRVFCRGLAVDALYLAMMVPFVGFIVPLYVAYLRYLMVDVAGIQPLALLTGVEGIAGLLVGYVAIDFLGWLHHLVRHKIGFFWRFHKIHHAQVEMNPFTNYRVHPLDWLNAQTVRFVPVLFLTDSLGLVLAYLAFHALHDRANHANLRTNLGSLRWVFVTPQSHRIHHSADPAHHDCNYGVSLCVWDRLFGTQHPDDRSFPATGVHDDTFPFDRNRPWYAAPLTLAAQLLHPCGIDRLPGRAR